MLWTSTGRRYNSLVKPISQPVVRWGHPLAIGLVGAWIFSEGGGTKIRSLINPQDDLTLGGNAAWARTAAGLTLQCPNSGTNTGASLTTPSALLKPSSAVSIFWRGTINGNGSLSQNPVLAGMTFTNSNISPFTAYAIGRVGASAGRIGYSFDWNGTNVFYQTGVILNSGPLLYGKPMDFCLTGSAGGVMLGYTNGGLADGIGTAANGNLTYGSPEFIINWAIGDATNSAQSEASCVYVWNRVLSGAEILTVHNDPFQFVGLRSLSPLFGISSGPGIPGIGPRAFVVT
jgi:hypothetical protein